MPSNKLRVYVALYHRDSRAPPDSYHWALLVSPKSDDSLSTTMQYHVKNTVQPGIQGQPWVFEASMLSDSSTRFRLLVRILVGKIKKPESLASSLRSVPIVQNDPGWTCISWVRDALSRLDTDGILTSGKIAAWDEVERQCRHYVAEKHAQGRWKASGAGAQIAGSIPTWDMLQGHELIS